MGAAAGRLKKSKHKDKVKQTVDLFRSGAYSTQNADKWIEQHIGLRIKLYSDWIAPPKQNK
jgi:hypothetical protein